MEILVEIVVKMMVEMVVEMEVEMAVETAVEMMGGMVAEKEMVMEAENVNELHEILLFFFSYE